MIILQNVYSCSYLRILLFASYSPVRSPTRGLHINLPASHHINPQYALQASRPSSPHQSHHIVLHLRLFLHLHLNRRQHPVCLPAQSRVLTRAQHPAPPLRAVRLLYPATRHLCVPLRAPALSRVLTQVRRPAPPLRSVRRQGPVHTQRQILLLCHRRYLRVSPLLLQQRHPPAGPLASHRCCRRRPPLPLHLKVQRRFRATCLR